MRRKGFALDPSARHPFTCGMLYCCNGAFKSGSTWLYILVCNLLGPGASLPIRFADPKRGDRGLHRDFLLAFLAEVDLAATRYVIKTHYADPEAREALLAHPDACVCGITRDLKDVVVSAYYHYVRKGEVTKPFADYFWSRGLGIARRVQDYNQLWTEPHSKIFLTRYELLQSDFFLEATRLCEFLNIPPNPEHIESVRENISFEKLQANERARKGNPEHMFFRSGKTHDWVSHLTPEMVAAVDAIQSGEDQPVSP